MTNPAKKTERRRTKRGQGEGSIYQRKDGRWAAAISLGYHNGKPQRKHFFGKTRADVQKALTKALHDHEKGLPVAIERQTVAQFLQRWLEDSVKPSVKPKTFHTYSDIVKHHLELGLGKKQLAKLSPQDVQQFINEKAQTGLSARTVRHINDTLRCALNVALAWGLVARNVAMLVTLPRIVKKEMRILTPAEAKIFLDLIKGDRLEAIFILALYLGLRKGEILGLRWDDVDFENRWLRIRTSLQRIDGQLLLSEPKSERSHRVLPIPETVLQALRAHRSRQLEERLALGSLWPDNNFVFTSEVGTPLEPRNVIRKFHALMGRPQKSRAKSPKRKRTKENIRQAPCLLDLRFHDLRHSCATLLLAQGVPLKVVSDILGHSQISLTADTYTHVLPTVRQEAIDVIDSLLKAN